MSAVLAAYLDSIDERLLNYLDETQELRVDTVRRLRLYASALLDDSIAPTDIGEDWPEWFDLAPAFVLAYGTTQLEEMQDEAMFLYRHHVGDGAPLTGSDRTYLAALEPQLDMYPETRMIEE
ncbi:MAG TPA: hypothetical protein VED63_01725 [Acidimicrobiales bacterium]|nr:hypothetical protein [Acidimicrobiales bacterium]